MQLRNRTPMQLPQSGSNRTQPHSAKQQADKRRRTSVKSCNPELPQEILHLLAQRLSIADLAAASTSCKAWAAGLRAGIVCAKVVIGVGQSGFVPNPNCTLPALRALSKHSSSLSELQLLVNNCSTNAALADTVTQLAAFKHLRVLKLCYMASQTGPRSQRFEPVVIPDNFDSLQVPCLSVEGSSMPSMLFTSLLTRLQRCKELRQLHLLLGKPTQGSQLPPYSPPPWVARAAYDYIMGPLNTTVSLDQLDLLVELTHLQELSFTPGASIKQANFRQLQKLKTLTSLEVGGCVTAGVFKRLALLTSLRKLTVTVTVAPGEGKVLEGVLLQHLRELNLGLHGVVHCVSALKHELKEAAQFKSCLKGLHLCSCAWSDGFTEPLSQMTSLTSLEMTQVSVGCDGQVDLDELDSLHNLRKFCMQFDGLYADLKLSLLGPSIDSSKHACAGRTVRHHQASPRTDISGMFTYWPHLQELRLSGLPQKAVSGTCWELGQLTGLTSLCLQFARDGSSITGGGHGGGADGDGSSNSNSDSNNSSSDGGDQKEEASGEDFWATFASSLMIRLDQLPRQLKDLQLMNCPASVPETVPFRGSLTSLSLSHVKLQPSWDLMLSDSQQHVLHTLLQDMQSLQQLELAYLKFMSNDILCAALGEPALGRLSSLSVIGIGNDKLTHGSLVALTGLRQLRKLRWHVGDLMDLLPDLRALAQLKSLVSFHIPSGLHTNMERWQGYPVLDYMPFCDVHVEAPV